MSILFDQCIGINNLMEMIENESSPIDYHSNVDTSRPFRSVKEAVIVFGKRLHTRPAIHSPKPFSFPKQETSWEYFPPSPPQMSKQTSWKSACSSQYTADDILVDAVKKLENELEETKEEIKLLKEKEFQNEVALALVHKNVAQIAQPGVAVAGKEAAVEGERRRDLKVRMERSSLAQIMSFSREKDGGFGGKKKKKPIIPLVGDLCFRRKG